VWKSPNRNSSNWKTQIENSNVSKSPNKEFQCLEKPKQRILIFGKAKIENSSVWKIENFNIWKRETPEFQCLRKRKSRISIFGKPLKFQKA